MRSDFFESFFGLVSAFAEFEYSINCIFIHFVKKINIPLEKKNLLFKKRWSDVVKHLKVDLIDLCNRGEYPVDVSFETQVFRTTR